VLHATSRAGLRTRALPVLLMSAMAAAFGGLAALAPVQADRPAVLAYSDAPPLVLDEPAAQERAQARASRDRRLDEQARAKAAAQAKAQAAAAAAKAKAAADAKAKAAAAAKAKADAASKAQAKAKAALRAKTARGALRIAGRCPVPNASFSDTYGAARSGGRSHKGTDLLAPYGSPVYAVADGRIRDAYSSNGGISLYLDADNGETYFYAHNSANVVKSGRVQAGQLIARVGSTGNAGGTNHVHFERVVGGRSVNPYAFLRGIC
jgi:murein DD-endopeptidase MepM/ murein hydrolase activator NlpD